MIRAFLLISTALAGAPCAATATSPQGPVITQDNYTAYLPDYFAASRPDNALDMVRLVPGFAIETTAAARGLGEAGGNVLVNRVRPPKTSSITAELQRIPAASVAAIVVYRGAQPGIDFAGYSMVVDVIQKSGPLTRGSVSMSLGAGARGGNSQSLSLEGSAGGARNRKTASASLSRSIAAGTGTHVVDAVDGQRLVTERSDSHIRSRALALASSADVPLGADTLAALNGSHSRSQGDSNEIWTDASGVATANYGSSYSSRSTRGTLEVRRDPAAGVRLAGTLSYSHLFSASDASAGTGASFTSTSVTDERAGRLTASKGVAPGATIEGGVDYAYNALEAVTELSGPSGPVVIPNSDLGVSEQRLGGFAALNWSGKRLSGEARLRADYAVLKASGARSSDRALLDIKPRLRVGYAADDHMRFDFSVGREVDQLPFSLFAASAQLVDGTVNAGTVDIDPERSWVAEFSVQRSFWTRGGLTVSARGEQIENPIGLIVTPEGFDATGNLGAAWRAKLNAQLSLPLDPLQLDGARLDVQQSYVHSQVTDPVTGEHRMLAGDRPWNWSVALRQDMPHRPISWGLTVQGADNSLAYRLAETQRIEIDPSFSAFVEVMPKPSLSLRAEASWGGDSGIVREIHAGQRDVLPIVALDQRSAANEARGHLTLRLAS